MSDILKCTSIWPLQGEPGHQLTQLNSPGHPSASVDRGGVGRCQPVLQQVHGADTVTTHARIPIVASARDVRGRCRISALLTL